MTYRDKTVPWTVGVVDIARFDDAFVRVVCESPANVSLVPGDTVAIQVEVSSQTLRRYTVSCTSSDTFEFVAFRTQRGPATPYLDGLSVGAQVQGQGPERPVKLPSNDMTHVAVMGDETVVGTAIAIAGATRCPVSIAMKTTNALDQVSAFVGASAMEACRDEDAMKSWLADFLTSQGTANVGVFLVGEQSVNQSLRQHAFSLGLDKDRLATRTFWRPDKAGLE